MVSAVRTREQDGIVIAALPPEIDLSNVHDVRAQLLERLQSSTIALVIDLAQTTYLDSKGIHLLMELEQRLQKSRQSFRLAVSPGSPLSRLLDIAGVPIPRHDTIDGALASIQRKSGGPGVAPE